MLLVDVAFDTLSQWAPILVQLTTALAEIAVVVGGARVAFTYAASRRDAIRLKQEQWRISYRNLNITHTVVLTHTANAYGPLPDDPSIVDTAPLPGKPLLPVHHDHVDGSGSAFASIQPGGELSQFLISRLQVENIGDGPVDIWACLVAARELNSGNHRENYGGNVEWNDLDPYYFDTKNPLFEPLAGISNTRHCVYSQDDYIQLDPKEHDTLTRIDRIDPVKGYITLLYRAFLVGRGYGGDFRTTPARNVLAWQRLQQALFNISGPSFRILFADDDPLDLVADRDGWQCFMLYHAAFTDDRRNDHGWTHIDLLNSELEGEWGSKHAREDAQVECRRRLADECLHWERHWAAFKQAVSRCKQLPDGFSGLIDQGWRPDLPPASDSRRTDLAGMKAADAFALLPAYLKWNPQDDDSLPLWEKFFVVTLRPEDAIHSPTAAARVRGRVQQLVR